MLRWRRLARATLTLLLIAGLSSTAYAAPTRQSVADQARQEQQELERLCKQALDEVEASRKLIADYERLTANLRGQIETLKAMSGVDAATVKNFEADLAAADRQIVALKEMLALREQQLAEYREELERVRKKVDELTRGRNTMLLVVGSVALAIGIALGSR
jgi:chromosome segregation ATPase